MTDPPRPPPIRVVDQFTGRVAPPEKYFAALSEADEFVREVTTLRARTARLDELEEELAEAEATIATLRLALAKAEQERDTLRARTGAP